MAHKFKTGDIVKREIWFKRDITAHSFNGSLFAIMIGTKDECEDVYHNLCLLINQKLEINKEVTDKWFGKNFGYVIVDDEFKDFLSADGKYTVEITEEIKPSEQDIQLWEKAKSKKIDNAIYDED